MLLAYKLYSVGLERIRGGGVDGSYPGLPVDRGRLPSMHLSEVLACWTAAGWGVLCPPRIETIFSTLERGAVFIAPSLSEKR